MTHSPDHEHDHHGGAAGRIGHLARFPIDAVRMARYFWSSPVSAAAIDRLDPQPGERVLDIGAGFGPAARRVVDRVGTTGSVVAAEPSKFMRTVLQARRAVSGTRAQLAVTSDRVERLALDDGSIDVVVGMNVMHHFDDLDRAIGEVARVLCPGGRLLFADEDLDDPRHPFHRSPHASEGDDDPGPGPHHVDADVVVELLGRHGLTDARAEREDVADTPALVVTATACA